MKTRTNEDEEDNAVPIAGIYNESDEKNKKKTRTTNVLLLRKKKLLEDENKDVVAEAEELLQTVEEIPTDDI